MLRNGKELEEKFSFSLTNFYQSIFSPTLNFFPFFFFFAKLNARFSTTMLLCLVESMHIWDRHVALMLWSAGNTWHSVLFDADEGEAGTRDKTFPLTRAAKSKTKSLNRWYFSDYQSSTALCSVLPIRFSNNK